MTCVCVYVYKTFRKGSKTFMTITKDFVVAIFVTFLHLIFPPKGKRTHFNEFPSTIRRSFSSKLDYDEKLEDFQVSFKII